MKKLVLFLLLCWPLLFAGSICTVVVGRAPGPNSTSISVNSTTADGWISHYNATYSTVRGATTGSTATANVTGEDFGEWVDCGSFNNSGYYIGRVFYYFDTSSLPDACTIDSVTLDIYCNYNFGAATAIAYEGTQGTTLSTADYDAFGSVWSDNVTLTASQWSTMTLTSTGISGISKTGTTKICVRNYSNDATDSAPAGTTTVGGITFSESSTHKPHLHITYH